MKYHVAIIGGGISGLATAFFLKRNRPELKIVLLENSPRLGGLISSYHSNLGPIEEGPYLFTRRKDSSRKILFELRHELEWEKADRSQSMYHMLNEKGISPLPNSFSALLKSALLSPKEKFRLLLEPFAPVGESDESLAEFGVRRFGKSFSELLLEAPAASIFSCGGEELSAALVVGQLKSWEQTKGSIAKGLWSQHWKSPFRPFPTAPLQNAIRFKGGMSSFVLALEHWLIKNGVVLLKNTEVTDIKRQSPSWLLELREKTNIESSKLVICVPAKGFVKMLPGLPQKLSEILTSMDNSPLASYVFSFLKNRKNLPRGFGFFVPPKSSVPFSSGVFLSNIFPNQFERDKHVLSIQVPQKKHARKWDAKDPQLLQELIKSLQPHILPAHFKLEHSVYLPSGMPVYGPYHLEKRGQIETFVKQQYPNIWLNHSFLSGSGLERCIEQSQKIADELGAVSW